ncbi:fam-c protein [Plasmodium chabaudi chabaudi]|uniref:Fam-c protein n=1 Tax=Plasmodium chabaudi chabaudi TaxID=31271 RepID=A0A4V6M9M6_PLACU|nr:fam-c protein [Plasmodium chabaudi chabaudi]VTZ69945.1 fam-c protein [Plasmodium chabaudi chabaudi]
MNKRIFSLVCIILYVILAVSIHCSEEKESGLRNRVIRVIKQIKRSNKKNDIASQRETKLNNNNNNNYRRYGDDDDDDDDYYYSDEETIITCCGCRCNKCAG